MVAWSAEFPGNSGPLPPTTEGLPFVLLRGSAQVFGGHGYAQPGSPGPFAVVEGGHHAGDGVLVGTFAPAAGTEHGQALYFRVVDVNNYWRAGIYGYTYQYQSGTTQTYVGDETYVSGYGTYPVEYEWRQNYTTGVTHGYTDTYGIHYATAWNTSTTTPPGFSSQLAHYHYLSGSYYPGDQNTHYHSTSGSPYRTGNTRGGGSYPIYATRPVYRTDPVYSTATERLLVLERILNGTRQRVASASIAAGATGLRVNLAGASIGATALGPGTALSATDSSLVGATRHGFGYLEGDTLGGYAGMERLTFEPSASGLYTPTIIR